MKKLYSFYFILIFDFYFSQSLGGTKENLFSNNLLFICSVSLMGLLFPLVWLIWKRNKKILDNYISPTDTNGILPEKNEKNLKNFSESSKETDRSYYISNGTANIILKKLIKFEKDYKYLKKDITLTWVASHLNTNTKYLSETIKIHRGKNFNNYINGLRISYITYMLYKKPEYREYKVASLARECGYSSSQVFVIAFKKENGIPPSYFIANLRSENPEVSFH